ncbi:MAG: glycosyltransferase family 4 protein [Candidatus Omnitrophica bacterium]|nr:glycosyltransferase family 4 protein [Candidatus Omnitrophota bacterium]HOX54359.1 glycosyltransferase family 4 protein [Candidatus Omnitrophota bacterium]
MNVLLLTTHLNPGGIASYVVSLAKGLKNDNHRVVVASSGGSLVDVLRSYDIPHVEINITTKSEISPKIFISLKKLFKTINDNDIQIIHAQTRVTQVLAFWLDKIGGIPFVSTCHGFFKPRLSRIKFPCWGRKVIAISEAVKSHLIQDLKVRFDTIELIYNGLEARKAFEYSADELAETRKWIGLRSRGPVIGNIARLSSVKGQSYLIEAMNEVVKIFPDAQLLVVGDGKIKDDLVARVNELGLNNNIFFIPSVRETSSILSLMDIFVMCSVAEGLGLSIMEAQAVGLPVIATEVGGIPELVKDGQTGILVPPQDSFKLAHAIISLLENREKARQLGANAQKNIRENFTLEKMISETERVYESVLK